MKTYARIISNTAVDVTVATSLATLYHPDVASQFVVVPDGTVNGATLAGSTWTAPSAPAPVAPQAPQMPLLTPMTLYMAFTPQERIAIKASADAMVKEFWAMFELSVQLEKPTDPNLVSVQNALAYLAQPTTVTPPGAGILASPVRIAQILAGVPQ